MTDCRILFLSIGRFSATRKFQSREPVASPEAHYAFCAPGRVSDVSGRDWSMRFRLILSRIQLGLLNIDPQSEDDAYRKKTAFESLLQE